MNCLTRNSLVFGISVCKFIVFFNAFRPRSHMLKVENSTTRKKKEDTVIRLKQHFESSVMAVNIKFQGLKVAELESFRRSLPADAHFTIAKNTLIRIASNETHGWSEFSKFTSSDSAILFIGDSIFESIKGYEDFVSQLDKSEGRALFKIQGGVIDGKALDPVDVISLKTIATRKESIKQLAIKLKNMPTKTAITIKSINTKLARAIKEVSMLDQTQKYTHEDCNNNKINQY